MRSASSLTTHLRTARKLSRPTELTLDVFNLFDRPVDDLQQAYQSPLACIRRTSAAHPQHVIRTLPARQPHVVRTSSARHPHTRFRPARLALYSGRSARPSRVCRSSPACKAASPMLTITITGARPGCSAAQSWAAPRWRSLPHRPWGRRASGLRQHQQQRLTAITAEHVAGPTILARQLLQQHRLGLQFVAQALAGRMELANVPQRGLQVSHRLVRQ